MPLSRKVSEPCPRYGDDSDVWMFEKEESTITKKHYTCESCGHEWTGVEQD
jgi:predicted RNA-binding Zn-ribbon protein involved in translation (DUF1610 family)